MKDTLLLNSVISCEELMNQWSVTEKGISLYRQSEAHFLGK